MLLGFLKVLLSAPNFVEGSENVSSQIAFFHFDRLG